MELAIEIEMSRQEWNYIEKWELVLNGNYETFHFSVRLSTVSNLALLWYFATCTSVNCLTCVLGKTLDCIHTE